MSLTSHTYHHYQLHLRQSASIALSASQRSHDYALVRFTQPDTTWTQIRFDNGGMYGS